MRMPIKTFDGIRALVTRASALRSAQLAQSCRRLGSTLAVLLAGCVSSHAIDVQPLAAGAALSPVPLDSVRYVEPEPEGCEPLARLIARSAQPDGSQVREELRARAAELGANRLHLTVSPAGSLEAFGSSLPSTQYSALALSCEG